MAKYIGIDLGTTFSSVATIDDSGNPVIVENDSIQESPKGTITASCIMLSNGKIVIGENARKNLQVSKGAIGRFKRDMGTNKTYKLGDREVSPQDLSSILLSRLKEFAEKKLGEISKAVVTVPANVSNDFRSSTMAAAKEAGLDIDHMINEPTAAALYYAYTNEIVNGKYAIFDLGGGTFDLSIIDVNGKDIDVITSNGIHKLGGDDFDTELVKKTKEIFKEAYDIDLEDEYTNYEAELNKITLSERKTAVAGKDMLAGEVHKLKRTDFEDSINLMLSQIEMSCTATVQEAGIKVEDINEVILVGGSSRIPIISTIIESVFKKPPVLIDKLDEAVALGAALYAAYKSDGKDLSDMQRESVNSINVGECANHSFGTSVLNPQTNQLYNDVLIPKNTKIPFLVEKEYMTIHDNQTTVQCDVTQSTEPTDDLEFVKKLWEGALKLPDGRPKGQKVTVTYSYDENELMSCTFLDQASGKKIEKQITMSKNDDDDIENILIE